MAPIKFEEQLKDKLEKRNLSPSKEGWSQLSNRLDNEGQKSKKSIYWWLSIAAGLIILVAVSIQFLNNDNSESSMPILVEEQQYKIKEEIPQTEIKNIEVTDLKNEETIIEDKKSNQPILDTNNIKEYKKVVEQEKVNKTQLAEIKESSNIKAESKKTEQVNNELQSVTEDALVKEAIASALQELKSENTTVTDREIDSLLKIASKELFIDKLQKESSKTVDAEALLRSVEDDMGQSFRSRVFEALKVSYETVKTAVAERNN